jgi:hypothetical protein
MAGDDMVTRIEDLDSDLPLTYGDQMFVWEEPDTKKIYTFNSSSLLRYWRGNPDCAEEAMIPVSEDLYLTSKEKKGVEEHRLARLTEDCLESYTIWLQWEVDADGKVWHTCIDGHHRIVWAFEHGVTHIKGLIFQKPVWSKCIIRHKNPAYIQRSPDPKSFSGIF